MSRPLKVMIVDDELPLREELRTFPWMEHQAELIAEASNGQEAFQLCQQLRPDVVVTDITMPIMDGLTLTRQIREQLPQMQVILLTCHGDFQYAREALQLGALGYLMKVTLEEEDMFEVLERAREGVERERIYRMSSHKKQREQQSRQLKQLLELKDCKEQYDLATKWWHMVSLDHNSNRVLAKICLDCAAADVAAASERLAEFWMEIEERCSELEGAWQVAAGTYVLLISVPFSEATALLNLWLSECQLNLSTATWYRQEQLNVVGAISEHTLGREVRAIVTDYQHLTAGLEARFYLPDLRFVTLGPQEALGVCTEQAFLSIAERLETLRWDRAGLVVFCREQLPSIFKAQRLAPSGVKGAVLRWMAQWSAEGQINDAWGHWSALALECSDIQQLCSVLAEVLDTSAERAPRVRREVERAQRIVMERMSEPLTLTLIAEEVGLSPQYLSRLFKEEWGESFNDFLTRVRIQKAIELLQTTTMKVYEVAEKIGVPNYRYFSVMFRGRTGVSPTDFKKKAPMLASVEELRR